MNGKDVCETGNPEHYFWLQNLRDVPWNNRTAKILPEKEKCVDMTIIFLIFYDKVTNGQAGLNTGQLGFVLL